MSEILRKWITTRLGVVLDFNLLSFGEISRDGTLLAQLLHSYSIINDEELGNVTKTTEPEIAFANLLYLNNKLRSVGVFCTDKHLQSIANIEGRAALKLFYELYLTLNSKNKLQIIYDQSIIEPDHSSSFFEEQRFVYRPKESKEPDLDTAKEIFKWHKSKYSELMEKCKRVRTEYVKHLEEKIRMSLPEPKKRVIEDVSKIKLQLSKIDQDTGNELDAFSKRKDKEAAKLEGKVVRRLKPCVADKKKAEECIVGLKKKFRKKAETKLLQTYMHKMLLADLLETLIKKQEREFKHLVSNKVLKQSYYEKQMTNKMFEVRHQKQVYIDNKKLENDLLLKKRDEQLMEELNHQHLNLSLEFQRRCIERQRALELHKRLYEEHLRQKYEKHYEMCSHVLGDIIDFTIKVISYKESFAVDVPQSTWKEWTVLFRTEQPLFDVVDRVDDIIEEEAGEEEEEENEALTMELYRQSNLDERDMEDYIALNWPWNLEELFDLYEVTRDCIEKGMNVVGHNVHRLLLSKYPIPPPPRAPELPRVFVAACIVNLTDDIVVTVLERILKKKNIVILDMQAAINYCLAAYKKETTREIDTVLVAESEKGGKGKKGKDDKKAKEVKGAKSKAGALAVPVIEKVEKECQTPYIFPDEEIKLTKKAELGRFGFETLNLGLAINNRLVAAMFVEYLKSFKDMDGWVLLNYPERLQDAIVLESTLTGRYINDESGEEEMEQTLNDLTYLLGEEEEREEVYVIPSDPYLIIRISKIVPNPQPITEEMKNKSYLSSYICLTETSANVHAAEEEEEECEYMQDYCSPIENFYTKLGCNHSFRYSSFDPKTLRELINMITKDDIFAKEMYEEIVKTVWEAQEAKAKELERIRLELEAASSKGKGKDKGKDKGSAKGKGKAEPPPPEPVAPPPPPEEPEPEPEPPPEPGEPRWSYIMLEQPLRYQNVLATLWEDMEEIYLNDFKQLFFLRRLYQNKIVPYVHKIDTHMTTFIERPDNKQEHLHKFQVTYNDIENDLREDDEFKAELHCRITEFRSKLWDICVTRMREAEFERGRIINEFWFTQQANIITNIYISAMQLELDRCFTTFQLIQDYYVSMVTHEPSEGKWTKAVLPILKITMEDEDFVDPKPFTLFEKTHVDISAVYLDIEGIVQNDSFSFHLNTVLTTSVSIITSWRMQTAGVLKKFETTYKDKVDLKIDKKKDAKPGKGKGAEKAEPEYLTEVRKNMENMAKEWLCAIEGEYLRAKYRLTLLSTKAISDVDELLLYGENLFHNVYNRINDRYHEEINSVDTVCEVFAKAVEACEAVQPRFVFEGAKFYIDKHSLMYDEPLQQMAKISELLTNVYFTITQLDRLTTIFLDLAPNGSFPIKTFMYLLQDIVVQNPEDGKETLLPPYWHFLQPYDVCKLTWEVFGKVEFINWKDFIVYSMAIPFPTEHELLDVRQQFREMDPDKLEFVNKVQFDMVLFWFEKDATTEQELLKCKLVKELLCKMFKVDVDRINYSALLLFFCKDENPMMGVVKAFDLCIGNLVCWNEAVGKSYIEVVRYQRFLREQERLDALSAAESVISSLMHRTIVSGSFSHLEDDVKNTTPNTSAKESRGEQSIGGELGSYIFAEGLEEEELGLGIPTVPEYCYFLPFEVIMVIMTAALPWHARVLCVEDSSLREHLEVIYESLRNEEFDNMVFAHEFLNNKAFKELLAQNNKFVIKNPGTIVKNMVEICTCEHSESSLD